MIHLEKIQIFMTGLEDMHMEKNKSPKELETAEYSSWQRGVLFLLRWGAWTASFMAMAHIINF